MLELWERTGEDVGHHYRPRCAESAKAFRAGSYGPDIGYSPGGHRFISDLAILPELADRHLGTGAGELGNYNLDRGRDESASGDRDTTKSVLQTLGWAA